MRKHLIATALLMAGLPAAAPSAWAEPQPQHQSQGTVLVQGTVLDENNEPVIGASVVQKGARGNAVATDAFGNFKLRVPAGAQLEFSYVGYKTSYVAASDGMTVYLQPTTEQLNELVAIGYGSQKRANLTGAVATVDVARTMDSRPVQDVSRALQGAVPGLTITTSNGDFSSNPSIKIRGTGTLSNNQNSNPLIVVDGVPVDDLSFVNPDDVADISVLKDAASAAIYGTRAAFGVILITTKQGTSKEKVAINYSNNFAWNSATDYAKFANTVTDLNTALQSYGRKIGSYEVFGMNYWDVLPFAEKWQEQHGGKPYTSVVELRPYQSDSDVGDYYITDAGAWIRYADWDTGKTLFQTAPAQKHNVSLEGASGKSTYRVSFGYDSKEGLMRYNPEKLQRYNASANIQTEIFSWLKAGARVNFSQREYFSPDLQRNSYQYMWRFPSFFETYGYVRDSDGNPRYFRNEQGIRETGHVDETISSQTRMQAWMQATIIPGLTLQADFTYGLMNMNSSAAQVPGTLWNNWSSNAFGVFNTYSSTYAAQSNRRTTMWNMNVFATYAKTFAENHNLKIMLGSTAERWERKYFYAQRNGLLDNDLPNINLTDGDQYNVNGSHTRSATAGFFGRINYDYKGIYLLEANGRYDGSSSFPEQDQWAFFPSFSAGYRFSEEAYFEPIKHIVSNGKLRASYGHVGNEAIGSYQFLQTVSQVTKPNTHWLVNGNKISEFSMPKLVSSSLTWERIITTDVGIDLGFFDNSLNLGFDWYQRDTKDMLAPGATLPSVLGTSAPYVNAGSLRTRGWELSLGWNHSFGDADVYATFALSDARSKITRWNDDSGLLYSYGYGYTPGTYYGDVLGFETDRYFEKSDFDGQNSDGSWNYKPGIADQTGLETIKGFHYGPGDVKYKDLDGDGRINNGLAGVYKLNGKYYVPASSLPEGYKGDRIGNFIIVDGQTYQDIVDNPNSTLIGKGTKENHGDLKVIGNALPRFEYSLRIGGAWKGFDIDMFFQGVGKRNVWATGSFSIPMAASNLGTFEHQQSYNRYVLEVDNSKDMPVYNIVDYIVDQNNDYPNMMSGAGASAGNIPNIGLGNSNFYPQSKYLMNMAYLRFKNLTVGYTLPAEITKKALIQRARVYFSADNLCFLYNGARKIHVDPELNQTFGGLINDGYGGFGRTVPMMRTLSFGIQVGF